MTYRFERRRALSDQEQCQAQRNPISYFNAIGIALLYSAGFFYKLSLPAEAYFISSPGRAVLLPAAVSVFIVTLLLRAAGAFLSRAHFRAKRTMICAGLAALLLIGLRGIIFIGGGSFNQIIDAISMTPWSRNADWLIKSTVICLSWLGFYVALRASGWPTGVARVARFAAALGFSLFCIAVLNIADLQKGIPITRPAPASGQLTSSALERHRRVVWIIFDELDYRLVLGDQVRQPLAQLKHFRALAQFGVSADQAQSPSDATATSIPSLLLGRPTAGARYLGSANYQLRGLGHDTTAFTESNSVFAHLPASNSSFSILGFYQPYCQIFTSAARCDAHPMAFYEWYQGLIDWAPWPLLRLTMHDPMYAISAEQHRLVPTFIGRRDDALTFLHLNVPHLSSHYAADHFHQAVSSDMQVQYDVNLRLADEMLGEIIAQLRNVSREQDVLLIVSGDHGFRLMKQRPDENRPVPWLAWRVGAVDGQRIAAPISTVHTAALIDQFLNNKIDTQSDLAHWWAGRLVLPRLAVSPKNHDD
ncbi:MAG: sulfatase-like hydrolase/transferase [Massilia sp.]